MQDSSRQWMIIGYTQNRNLDMDTICSVWHSLRGGTKQLTFANQVANEMLFQNNYGKLRG